MTELLTKLAQEWAVIQAAPFSFFVTWLLASVISFLVLRWSLGAVNSRLKAEISLLERQLGDYREKLEGRSPDEAKAKIEELEAKIGRIVGRVWPPLSAEGREELRHRLVDVAKMEVHVFSEDVDGAALAKSLLSTFQELGWKARRSKSMFELDEGLIVFPDTEIARAVRSALSRALQCDIELRGDEAAKRDNKVVISIGYKPE
jgi:hypothetical protein